MLLITISARQPCKCHAKFNCIESWRIILRRPNGLCA